MRSPLDGSRWSAILLSLTDPFPAHMKIFHCDLRPTGLLESTQCVHCGHTLAYLPDLAQVGALEPLEDGVWRSLVEHA